MDFASDVAYEILDEMKCSICLEVLKEPKALPCIHTFCLHCLQTLYMDNGSGDLVSCPFCRKVFSIPLGGIQDLPTNFFMNKLLEIQQSAAVRSAASLCDPCSVQDQETTATSYCVECEEYMCDGCSLIHRQQKMSKSHLIVDAKDIPSVTEQVQRAVRYCDQHPHNPIKLYCYDCKALVCVMCCVKKHNKHECIDVKEAAEKFSEQLKEDVKNIKKYTEKSQEVIKEIEDDKMTCIEAVASAENKISQKYDQLISLIQSHQSQLIKELGVFKENQLKKLENHKNKVEKEFLTLEGFTKYCQETIIDKGTAWNVALAANDLHVRAKELLKIQEEYCYRKPCDVDIIINTSFANLIGELTFTG